MTRWKETDVDRLPEQQKPQGWRNGKPAAPLETDIQQACIRAFRRVYPDEWDAKKLHAVPNGGARHITVAAKMKAEGQVPGVWDMNLTIPRGKYAGFWVETKRPGQNLTDEQKKFQESHAATHAFAIIHSPEEFLQAIADYMALGSPFNSIQY